MDVIIYIYSMCNHMGYPYIILHLHSIYMVHVWYISTIPYLALQVWIINKPSFAKHKPNFNPGLEKTNKTYQKIIYLSSIIIIHNLEYSTILL